MLWEDIQWIERLGTKTIQCWSNIFSRLFSSLSLALSIVLPELFYLIFQNADSCVCEYLSILRKKSIFLCIQLNWAVFSRRKFRCASAKLVKSYSDDHDLQIGNSIDLDDGIIFRFIGPLCGVFTSHSCECPSQKPETRSFDIFFDPRLKKRLSKQSIRRWF